MPGVPPDALATVKKGFKSLFNRKKKDKKDPAPASTMTPTANTAVTDTPNPTKDPAADMTATVAKNETPNKKKTAGTGTMQPAPTQKDDKMAATASSGTPQISEPANVSQSKNIDLNPSSAPPAAPAASVPSTSTATDSAAMKSKPQNPSTTDTADATKFEPKPPAEGMSATSGPLSDDLGGDYGGAQVEPVMAEDEAKGNIIQEAGKKST